MNKLIVFIMLATIPFLLGFFGIGMPEVIVILVILGSIGLPILIAILIINAKKERVPPQSVQTGKFCSNCGKEIAPNAYVCLGCGVKLVQESSTNKNKLVAALRHPPHEYVRKTSVQTLKEMTGRDFGDDLVEWEELRDENRLKFTEAEIGKIKDATAVQPAEEVGRPASEITDEDSLYVQTLQELEPDQMDKATWVRAFAEEHGDEKILALNPGASEEMRNHTRSDLPPDEPPPKWEKEQFSTTENRSYGESEPTSNELPLAAAVCVIFICLMIAVVVVVKSGDVQPQASSSSVETLSSNPPPQTSEVPAVHWYNEGHLFLSSDNYVEAIEAYSKAIALNPHLTAAYDERAFSYYKLGKLQEAIEDFNKSISLNPNHAEAYFQRGHIYCYELEQYGKALEDFNKVIELDPNNGGAYYGRGYIFAHKYPKYDKAVEDFSKAIELISNNHGIYFQRGYVYFELGKCDNAIKDITVAINLNPNNDDYYVFRARYYMEKSKYDEAIDDLNKAMALKPGEALAYSLRGAIHLRKGNFIKAIEDFNKAIEINPNHANYYNDRGYTYLELGKYESAIKDFSRALEVDKKHADSYVGLSIVYFRQKKMEKSKTYYQKAIEIEPLFKNEMNVIEKGRRYFYTQSQKQTIKEILKLCSNR